MDDIQEHDFAIHDNNGIPIEMSKHFNTGISGYAFDIIQKSRSILDSKDKINSIEIFYENAVVLIKDNVSTKLNMTMIIDKTK
jgi:hypothetical protein